MLMGVVDTMMVGRVSAEALAAVALGNLYSWWLTAFGMGLLMVLDPVVSQALGANDEEATALGIQRGFLLAVILTLPTALLHLPAGMVLELLRQPAGVVPIAEGYAWRMIPGLLPFMVFVAVRQTLQAYHRTGAIVITILLANAVNALLNYGLIFGRLGFPELGALGSAWATSLSRWFMALMLLGLAWRDIGHHVVHWSRAVFRRRPLARMTSLGAPIGAQMALEGGAFATIALLMGSLGTIQVASHQVAINMAALTFMVPVGISSAAAVIAGHAVGRGDPGGVRRSSLAALLIGGSFMSVTMVVFLAAPGFLARLYTTEALVVALTSSLIPIAGVFQVFDGLQVVTIGLLRGIGDTRGPMVIGILGFWFVGLPVSLMLAFPMGLGALGLWWGLVAGLAAVAGILLLRLRSKLARPIDRIRFDEHTPHPFPLAES